MQNFYSIINIAPNPTANESVSVGLLLVSPTKIWVKFSAIKQKIARALLGENESALDFFEKQVLIKVEEQNKLITKNDSDKSLFLYEHSLSSNFFNYLHVYSNNLLQFSKPVALTNNVTNELFDSLFSLLVAKEESSSLQIQDSENRFIERIENNLIKKVASKVHTHQSFNKHIIPALYFAFEMDCIGLNGVFTGAKSISFEKSPATIDSYMSHYFVLTELLERKYQKHTSDNNFFIIADEPKQKQSKEHELWIQIRLQNKFEVISSEEAEFVAEKVESTGAKTFLEGILS